MKSEIFCDVSETGELSLFKKKEIRKCLQGFAGKRIIISLERLYNKRSNQQNRFFHGVCLPILSKGLIDIGYNEAKSLEWTKDFIKANCLMVEIPNPDSGELMKSIRRTSELTTSEFMDLIADIQRWSMQTLNIYIPDPAEQTEIF